MTKEQTAGQRMITSAKQALAFALGQENGCVVHIPDKIDTARMYESTYSADEATDVVYNFKPPLIE